VARDEPSDDILLEPSPFDRLYGLRYLECRPDVVRAAVSVRRELTQPLGLVHGGDYASIAEAVASTGTNRGVAADGMMALGASNHTSFLRPVSGGTIHATAERRHAGRTLWIWDVEMCDDDGRACAVARMTIAVRPR
jgi:1,4-dihydroxy-2-naphthoyl-CoA hydrolase